MFIIIGYYQGKHIKVINIGSKTKYIVAKEDACIVSIRCAKVISFHYNEDDELLHVIVEVLDLIHNDDALFTVGEIYEMGVWDFKTNYKYINETKLLAKVL